MPQRRASFGLVLALPLALAACQSTEQSTSPTSADTAPEAALLASPAQRASWAQSGFAVYEEDGRLWVVRAHGEAHAAAESGHFPEKHVTRVGAGPQGATVKASDVETLDAWVAAG